MGVITAKLYNSLYLYLSHTSGSEICCFKGLFNFICRPSSILIVLFLSTTVLNSLVIGPNLDYLFRFEEFKGGNCNKD